MQPTTHKFGFPFILAVRGHDRSFDHRRACDSGCRTMSTAERAEALAQIGRIAAFRLAERVACAAGAQIMAMHERLAAIQRRRANLTCAYLRPRAPRDGCAIRDYMLGAGLDVHIDAVGNVVGRWRCGEPGAKTLITGSHYDTVINGGRYDGRLGILLPIAVRRRICANSGYRLPFDLEIVAFAEEEGVRFKSTFLGSSASPEVSIRACSTAPTPTA